MKIKKIDEEVTYLQKNITHRLEVNGKEVRVYDWQKQDMVFSDYDSDTSVDEKDLEKLTDEESEELHDYLSEAIDAPLNEEWDTNEPMQ